MFISPEFILKHVRPYDAEAYDLISYDPDWPLLNWLRARRVPEVSISLAFDTWRMVSGLEYTAQTRPLFLAAARVLAQSRWEELYAGSRSTVLFLTAPLLHQLSYFSHRNPGQAFDFRPYQDIPLALTIDFSNGRAETQQDVAGAALAADSAGFCSTFTRLLPK
ncbi:hypothetical protein KIH74_34610 [Kineosporia sp. J2-2]|uniref:Uncharacterized protein n=1 Tax=Kineosporia corallincola TaxID=2835133 RepID=A0ABS5TTR0_9ACTN|nr:hypothetical protein [Kineosporia corallincola]MBT0774129.1 hypothetical protein [Kineosporia corallincola]